MNTVYFLVQQTMFFSIPLLIVALGGMFSERSGVVNIALEGIMIMGAFSSILFINIVQSSGAALPPQLLLLLAVLIAAAVGVLVSIAHAYASINMKADQVISGTAINMFAPAFAIFAARMIRSVQQIPFSNTFRITKVPVLGDIPVLGPLLFQNTYITTYLGFAVLAVSAVVLYKTRFGLRLRACGEHPRGRERIPDALRGRCHFRRAGRRGRPCVCGANIHQLQRHSGRLRLFGAGGAHLRPMETQPHPVCGVLLRFDENGGVRVFGHPVPGKPGHPQRRLQNGALCSHTDRTGVHQQKFHGAACRRHSLRQGQPLESGAERK